MNVRDKVVYPWEEKLKTTEARIEKLDVRDENKELVFKFRDHLINRGVKAPRVEKHLDNLSRILKWVDKDFKKVTKSDIEALMSKIIRMNVSEWTKYDYQRTIRSLFTWLGKSKAVSWITLNPPKRFKLPDEILTEAEIERMIEFCETQRDRAIVSVLYESGLRAGEFLNIRLKHITFDDKGAVLTVHGKTGWRRVRIVSSVPHLLRYLDVHPNKDDPESPLWVNVGYPRKGQPLEYRTLVKQLKTIAKRAGIKKRIYPHLFRHSRATHLANFLTEAQMCEFFGWVQGSDMPRIYIHLSGRDVDNAILAMYGMEEEEKETIVIKAIKCQRCGAINEGDARFCMRCGFPMVEDAQIDVIAEDELREKTANAMLKDSLFRKLVDALTPEELKLIETMLFKEQK